MSVKVDSELLVDGEDGTETAFEVNVTGYETHTQNLQLLASDREGVKNLTGEFRNSRNEFTQLKSIMNTMVVCLKNNRKRL